MLKKRESSFHRLYNECKEDLPNLTSRRQFNARRKLTARLAEEIRKDVAIAIDGSEDVFCIDSKPVKTRVRDKNFMIFNQAKDIEYWAAFQGRLIYLYSLVLIPEDKLPV